MLFRSVRNLLSKDGVDSCFSRTLSDVEQKKTESERIDVDV